MLAHTSNAVEDVAVIVKAICVVDVEPDGLSFEPQSVAAERIREQADYAGVRVRFRGSVGSARVNMQIDMGFADVVTPGTEMVEYPSLLDMPRPRLRGYSRETVVAEKLQALVVLGQANSRMKDFFDLWLLSRTFEFDTPMLASAITRTFARRATGLPNELPVGLTDEFARSKQSQWLAFLRTNQIGDAPQEFLHVVAEVRAFIWPVIHRAAER